MEVKVVDNFLSKEEHNYLLTEMTAVGFPWFVNNHITKPGESQGNLFALTHLFQIANESNSTYYEPIIKNILLPKMDVLALHRVKANLYPGRETLHTHTLHVDNPWSHKGAIYYLNTNNGYTEFEDGTRVESVANRMMYFDPSIKHSSTDCTDDRYRININFNYF